MGEEFNFEEEHRRFPEHWDKDGRPAINSTWRSREHPMMRVRVSGRDGDRDVTAMVYWDGDLEGLRLLFAQEPSERWNIAANRLVYGPAGIYQLEAHERSHGERYRWRRDTATLDVVFEREQFGGPDTWHIGMEGVNLPFFEPIPDWD